MIDADAFMAGFGIAEYAAVLTVGATVGLWLLRKFLRAAGW